ncbi:MAG: ABC transporter permease [Deltaproteobacteria bacterium]|nr:ABC transporter permease [Deltaproteobacteria bacterium]
MNELAQAFKMALALILTGDSDLLEIVWLTMQVSISAVAVASLAALPLGGALALFSFPGRRTLIILLNSLMGLPPVVVGLLVYLLLSRQGPLGEWGLLFTPTAMVIAQCILVFPIVAALTRQVVEDLWGEYGEQLRSLGASRLRSVATLLLEGRFALSTVVLAGFGRAIAEVGAVLIVGGNIAHLTRVMTTAIALETSRGELSLALGLGILLIGLSVSVNGAAYLLREYSGWRHG